MEHVNEIMEQQNEIMEKIHESLTANQSSKSYIEAAVTCSLTVGFTGATLKGWITFNDQSKGKIHFKSGKIHGHKWYFVGAGALPSVKVLIPEKVEKTGSFEASGSVAGGALMLYSKDGTPIFEVPFPVAGAGAPYWKANGDVNYTK
jgi:hypothetical protein